MGSRQSRCLVREKPEKRKGESSKAGKTTENCIYDTIAEEPEKSERRKKSQKKSKEIRR